MAKKKNVDLPIQRYKDQISGIRAAVGALNGATPEVKRSVYEWAVIALYAAIEELFLESFTAAINRNPTHVSAAKGVPFPKHMTVAMCRYLIVGDGYFGFRDRDDLKKKCKAFLGDGHDLIAELNGDRAAVALEVMTAARNYAAHQSAWAKEKLRGVLTKRGLLGAKGLSTSGAYLSAIDSSAAWITPLAVQTGKTRLFALLAYADSLGSSVEDKVTF